MSPGELKPGEREAREVLRRLLGVPVEPADEGGGVRSHDLDVGWPEGPTWAVEVKMETDALTREAVAALGRHGYAVETEVLRSRWVVSLLPGADVKRARVELPQYLAEVEGQGWSEFVRAFARFSDLVDSVVQGFRVWHGKKVPGQEQPRLLLLPPDPVGSWVRPVDAINEVVSKWASREDVREKLRASGAAERHLFVWVMEDAPDVAWILIDAEYPPPDPPQLPREVTGAWIATGDPEDPIVWFARPNRGWDMLQGRRQWWPGMRMPDPPRPE